MKMREEGFEPPWISPLDLETNSLTARTLTLFKSKTLKKPNCFYMKMVPQGFEPWTNR
jgi:hypothetical protein